LERRKLNDETYLPTEQNQTRPNPWIQKKNVDEGRSSRYKSSAGTGQKKIGGLAGLSVKAPFRKNGGK
jgi:hypothetical protein